MALDRDDPARLQIVCVNGANFMDIKAEELFPPGKVRDCFKNPKYQVLEYDGNEDKNQQFRKTVERRLIEYHNEPVASSIPVIGKSLFETLDPWQRFAGRKNVWKSLK